jgi:hypothetical protein
MNIKKKIEITAKILELAKESASHPNRKDIRSVTPHILALTIQNYLITLILSRNLSNLGYLKANIYEGYEEDDLSDLEYNFDGYQSNAVFINLFIHIEIHIRQIAIHYETPKQKLNHTSITKTFNNIINMFKLNVSDNDITDADVELFKFFCFLRNTMHNGGFHIHPDKTIIVSDKSSIFGTGKKSISLKKNQPNRCSFEEQLLIYEQIIKLIKKINSLIQEDEHIEHQIVHLGFNKE